MKNTSFVVWTPCNVKGIVCKPTAYKKYTLRVRVPQQLYSKMVYDDEIIEWPGDEYNDSDISCMTEGLCSDQVLLRYKDGDFGVARFFISKNGNYWAWIFDNKNIIVDNVHESLSTLEAEWRYFVEEEKYKGE